MFRFKLVFAFVLIAFVFSGCGREESKKRAVVVQAPISTQTKTEKRGNHCVVQETDTEVEVTCEDGGIYKFKKGCPKEVTEDEIIFTCEDGVYRIPRDNPSDKNPLLGKSPLPFGAYQWDKIKPEHVIPAIKVGIKKSKALFDRVVEDSSEPTFSNTIETLETTDTGLEYSLNAYFGVSSLLSERFQPLQGEVDALLNEFSAYMKNKKYHAKIRELYEKRKDLDLTPLQMRLLESTYKSQVRNGLALADAEIQKVNKIDLEISKLQQKFAVNGTKSKETFNLVVENLEDLEGLPESLIKAAAARAKDQKKSGYVLTLDTGVWAQVLDNSKNSELRKLFFIARQQTALDKGPLPGFDGSQYDNSQIIIDIAKLRLERAKILGFKNHAEWKLQDKMASTPENVMAFMDDLLEPVKKQSEKELALLYEFKRQKGDTALLKQWDVRYWAEQYRKEKLGVDSQELRKYFELNRVLKDGVFYQGEQFWGLSFQKDEELPTFQPDVQVYRVKDEKGQLRSILYLDLYARKGKRSGAWMAPLRQRSEKQEVSLIHVVMNIPKPVDGEPTLLTVDDARTLFHEFGHAYHTLLSDVKYSSMAGSSVPRDFVEVPSQVPEAFVSIKEILKNYAKHYKTGEPIPDRLVDKLEVSRKFMLGEFELRQMRLAYTDMAWHLNNELPIAAKVSDFEKAATKKATHTALAVEENIAMSTNFGHIFAGGYDAGYYGYQWARVIGSDLFAAFTENGGFSLSKAIPIGKKLRKTILSRGDSAHPAVLFRNFRGRDYKKDFFLESLRSGPTDVNVDGDDGEIPRHRLVVEAN